MTKQETYQPSSGTEGMWFMKNNCFPCRKWHPDDGCIIQSKSQIYKAGEKEYPQEWVYDEDGNPTCTAFSEP